jgi:Carbohydrate family 9 binding domain-like
MNICVRTCCIVALAASALLASGGTMLSVRAEADAALDTNPNSSFWKDARPVVAELNNYGKQVPGHATEVRSRWTAGNLYFLFICPYQELYLKPHPVTSSETNELWNWDVAEVFIGADFKNIKRYREFEISPQAEWVDLDIDRSKPHPEDGWVWNSGFQISARIDRATNIWYGAMRIPWTAIDAQPPKAGAEFRLNLYRSQGPPKNHKAIAWQPTMDANFHVPERFGLLKLE